MPFCLCPNNYLITIFDVINLTMISMHLYKQATQQNRFNDLNNI